MSSCVPTPADDCTDWSGVVGIPDVYYGWADLDNVKPPITSLNPHPTHVVKVDPTIVHVWGVDNPLLVRAIVHRCIFEMQLHLTVTPHSPCRFSTLSPPDVLLLSVLHDDDSSRQWHCVLRAGSADDDSEGGWFSIVEIPA